jgi:hypothetical protein
MTISYETSVDSAMAWHIVVNESEAFLPIQGKVVFTRTFNSAVLTVRYVISALNGTEVTINYGCQDNTGKNFEDESKESPHSKTVQNFNSLQITLNIPLS